MSGMTPPELFAKLTKQLEANDRRGIEESMQIAKTMNLDVQRYGVLKKGHEYVLIIKHLNDALRLKDLETLNNAVKAAKEAKFEGAELDACRKMRKEISHLGRRAAEVMKTLELEEMKQLVNDAEKLEFLNADIIKINDILKHFSDEKLLQMQLKAAVANGDSKRITKLTIQVKDKFFEKMGTMFQLSKFPKLRKPSEFADSKILASSHEKDDLALKFLMYTKTPIHISLIQFSSYSLNRQAQKLFKHILRFMGDRRTEKRIVDVAVLIVTAGIQFKEIRDEIYVQIMKQLTHNSDEESSLRGWDLMHLCLTMFPPGSDLENYLEYWLRTQSSELEYSLGLLYEVTTKGARTEIPSAEEVLNILHRGDIADQVSTDLEKYTLGSPVNRNWSDSTSERSPRTSTVRILKSASSIEEDKVED